MAQSKTKKRSKKTKVSRGLTAEPESTSPASAAAEPELVVENNTTSVVPRKPTSTTPVDPMMAAYMREVNKYPLLTREEERKHAIKWFEEKDKNSFQKLVTSNLRFVVKIAYEYVYSRAKLLDLVQEGNTGLLKAVQEFDPYRDVRLTTYAVWWIRSYIQDHILKNYSLVKMGTTRAQKKLFYRLRKEQRELEKMGIGPGREQVKLLAERLDVKEKEVTEMSQRMRGRDFSLNAPLGDEEDRTHMEVLSDETAPTADEFLGDREQASKFSEILQEFAETLEGRDKEFFEKRLISEKPQTLQSLGEQFGVSKERARQIEAQIKDRLKSFVQEHFPDYDILAN